MTEKAWYIPGDILNFATATGAVPVASGLAAGFLQLCWGSFCKNPGAEGAPASFRAWVNFLGETKNRWAWLQIYHLSTLAGELGLPSRMLRFKFSGGWV